MRHALLVAATLTTLALAPLGVALAQATSPDSARDLGAPATSSTPTPTPPTATTPPATRRAPIVSAPDPSSEATTARQEPPGSDAASPADARGTDIEELVPVAPIDEPAPGAANSLGRPEVGGPEHRAIERSLVNLEIEQAQLDRDSDQRRVDVGVTVALYTVGGLAAIGALALWIGALLEGICYEGDISECFDAPSFVSGAIATSVTAAALLYGGTIPHARFTATGAALSERRTDLRQRRRSLKQQLRVDVTPFGVRVAF